jgi:hypothetical protein
MSAAELAGPLIERVHLLTGCRRTFIMREMEEETERILAAGEKKRERKIVEWLQDDRSVDAIWWDTDQRTRYMIAHEIKERGNPDASSD